MGRAERIANVRGAFRVARPERIRGRSVVLVDDVFTTGSTLGECARVLREAGAADVRALTLARA
jgi:predicted amidophosphoribosyltransferase